MNLPMLLLQQIVTAMCQQKVDYGKTSGRAHPIDSLSISSGGDDACGA